MLAYRLTEWLAGKIVKIRPITAHPDYDKWPEATRNDFGKHRSGTIYVPLGLNEKDADILLRHEMHHVQQYVARFFVRLLIVPVLIGWEPSTFQKEAAAFGTSVRALLEHYPHRKAPEVIKHYAGSLTKYDGVSEDLDACYKAIYRAYEEPSIWA